MTEPQAGHLALPASPAGAGSSWRRRGAGSRGAGGRSTSSACSTTPRCGRALGPPPGAAGSAASEHAQLCSPASAPAERQSPRVCQSGEPGTRGRTELRAAQRVGGQDPGSSSWVLQSNLAVAWSWRCRSSDGRGPSVHGAGQGQHGRRGHLLFLFL